MHLGGVLGHLGRLLRPLGAVLGDLEASWWRLGPLEARFTPQGGGEAVRAHARAIPTRRMADPLNLKDNQAPIKRGKGKGDR